ncbi:MAG: type VII secretion protein EccB, partial [Micromonosporaceae bacterium]|nr:type VII secretion protein EccB [Micromonosporaceae bacterium]
MASRRDQLHSYQFMIQRVVAALVMRETDPAQSPFRRAAGASFAGIMIGVIVIAGFAIYGLWKPGGNLAWKEWSDSNNGQAVVVVEEEAGATYVYMNHKLYPMENITSALLVGNTDQRTREPYYVSSNSLATDGLGISRGPKLGIRGAPDSLPGEQHIVDSDWTLCSQPEYSESGDTDKLETVLVVGDAGLSDEQHLAGESVMLVEEESTSQKYLIYQNHRFKISAE